MRSPLDPANPEPDSAQILAALHQVLASDKFMAAPQMSAFLRYVVEQVIKGERKRIKAYTVAVEALGKPDTFDPQNDPVVRVLAGRLRASLSAFYETNPNTGIYIEMKRGSYAPVFLNHTDTSKNLIHQSTVVCSKTIGPALGNAAAPSKPKTKFETSTTTITTKKAGDTPSIGVVFSSRLSSLLRFPTVGLALIALALGGTFLATRYAGVQTAGQLIPAKPGPVHSVNAAIQRPRPEQVSIFVGAGSDDSLREQLNTILSGLLLEFSELRVHRKFDELNTGRYWPEDYLLSLNVLPLPSETRINVQLIEAQTGRITHSEILLLSKNAYESLTHEEVSRIMQLARQLGSNNGPLLLDYQTKMQLSATPDN